MKTFLSCLYYFCKHDIFLSMKKYVIQTLLLVFCLKGYAQQQYADSLIHFVLIKNEKDTVQNQSYLTWQDLHTLKAKIKLHSLTAEYGVTHRNGIICFEIFCNTKIGWVNAGTTEIPFVLSASILKEPIAVYSYLKMKRAYGKVQIKIKKIILNGDDAKSKELYFSDYKSITFYLTGKDSTS